MRVGMIQKVHDGSNGSIECEETTIRWKETYANMVMGQSLDRNKQTIKQTNGNRRNTYVVSTRSRFDHSVAFPDSVLDGCFALCNSIGSLVVSHDLTRLENALFRRQLKPRALLGLSLQEPPALGFCHCHNLRGNTSLGSMRAYVELWLASKAHGPKLNVAMMGIDRRTAAIQDVIGGRFNVTRRQTGGRIDR